MVTRSTLLSPVLIVSVTGAAIAEDDETDARVAGTTGYAKFCSDVFQSGWRSIKKCLEWNMDKLDMAYNAFIKPHVKKN